MLFNPKVETIQRDKLRQLQSSRLKALMHKLHLKVPFYKNKFNELGIKPSAINDINDIPQLPFTYKSDLRENYPFGLLAVQKNELARIHCSSGTTGKPTVVGYNKADLQIMAEVNARSLCAAGAKPGMTLHNAYGYGLFTGGLGLHAGAEKLGLSVIPVSGGMTDRQIMILKDFAPDILSCTPSYAQRLAEEIKDRGITFDELNLKYGILGAEPWSEAIRKEVEAGLNIKASNIYGLSEIIGPGVSQEDVEEKGSGSYIWEDHFYPEVIDAETAEVLPEGKVGVLVFTTLTKQAMPLLRYWTNDICSLHYDKAGKRSHIKMGSILGRADDMLIIRGVNFFPSQIESVLPDFIELAPHYQLTVVRVSMLDEVSLQIELKPDVHSFENIEGLQRRLRKKIKDVIGIHMAVQVLTHNQLPRSEGGKLNRVIDKRKI